MSDLAVALLRACALIHHLGSRGRLDGRQFKINNEPDSPWVYVDIGKEGAALDRYAVRVRSGDLHVVEPCGAIGCAVSLADLT